VNDVSDYLDRLIAEIDAQPKPVCAQLTPFRIAGAEKAAATVRLEFAPQPLFGNHFGNVQGGFAMAMIDCLTSLAGYVATGEWIPTIEMRADFLAPLPIGPCIGEGVIVKAGRSAVFAEAKLFRADGQVAISASSVMLRAKQ
jgi:uncharacterized protein (TIGR00369 family)